MKLVFEADTLSDLRLQVIHAAKELSNETQPTYVEPETTGSVEQDQSIVVPTSTPSREDLKPKRTRRTKAEIEAAKANDLADGPANSRPVTGEVTDAPKSEDFSGKTQETKDDELKLQNFKTNFTQTVFLLLQNQTIDSNYIAEKVKYYGLTDLMTMKKDEKMMEHFYQALRSEGKI